MTFLIKMVRFYLLIFLSICMLSNVLFIHYPVHFTSTSHLSWSYSIGHFRVPLCLCFKASLSAKPFLWKWLICMRMKLHAHAELIFIRKVSHLDSFWNRGTRELWNGLLTLSYLLRSSKNAHNAVEIDILGIFEVYSSLRIWPPQNFSGAKSFRANDAISIEHVLCS